MGLFDKIFGSKSQHNAWEPSHRGIVRDVSYDDIVNTLGSPRKAKGRFVYWRGPMSDIDPDYSDAEFFQLSNSDYRPFGIGREPSISGETWFVLGTSSAVIRILGNEIGGIVKDIELIDN